MEPTLRFELRTCCLRNSCSTAELCRLVFHAWIQLITGDSAVPVIRTRLVQLLIVRTPLPAERRARRKSTQRGAHDTVARDISASLACADR
jgi:hypothetical protein